MVDSIGLAIEDGNASKAMSPDVGVVERGASDANSASGSDPGCQCMAMHVLYVLMRRRGYRQGPGRSCRAEMVASLSGGRLERPWPFRPCDGGSALVPSRRMASRIGRQAREAAGSSTRALLRGKPVARPGP